MTDIPNMIRTIRAETGLSQVGFGAALGIREKTVRMQLTRARRKLKQELESEETADDISI